MRAVIWFFLASLLGSSLGWLFLGLALLVASCQPAHAADVPRAAEQYRRTLVRAAHAEWGLDAPIATMAGQIHQESAWRANARSLVGAQGLAQFMPATADWMAELYPRSLGPAQPYNPGWALRAMVQFDRWLYVRNQANSECERWAFVLSGYNGGNGWVNRDRRLASAKGADQLAWFDSVERHNAGRSAANFRENRHYPRAILLRWEPLYAAAGWGVGVCGERYSHETSAAHLSVAEHRQRTTCRLFPQLARCRRAVQLAGTARAPAPATAAQVTAQGA
jgi:hypothetical protein